MGVVAEGGRKSTLGSEGRKVVLRQTPWVQYQSTLTSRATNRGTANVKRTCG